MDFLGVEDGECARVAYAGFAGGGDFPAAGYESEISGAVWLNLNTLWYDCLRGGIRARPRSHIIRSAFKTRRGKPTITQSSNLMILRTG